METKAAWQRDYKAVHRQTLLDQDEKLARAKACVLSLEIRIEAQKKGAAASPLASLTVPNLFENLNLPQNGTLATLLFQTYRTQAINRLFSDLAV